MMSYLKSLNNFVFRENIISPQSTITHVKKICNVDTHVKINKESI